MTWCAYAAKDTAAGCVLVVGAVQRSTAALAMLRCTLIR